MTKHGHNPRGIESDPASRARAQADEQIQFWRKVANSLIEAEGGQPSEYSKLARGHNVAERGPDTAALTRAAAQLLCQLDRVETHRRILDRDDTGAAWAAVSDALRLAVNVHNMTMADWGKAVATHEVRKEWSRGHNDKRKNDAAPERAIYQKKADRIWARNPTMKPRSVARTIVAKMAIADVDKRNKLIDAIRKKIIKR